MDQMILFFDQIFSRVNYGNRRNSNNDGLIATKDSTKMKKTDFKIGFIFKQRFYKPHETLALTRQIITEQSKNLC